MSGTESQTTPVAPFDEQAALALGQLQHAFEAVVAALPDPVDRAADLQHALKLDKVLSWRIFNVMRRADPFVAARYVPGSSAVKSFLRAAQRSGVPTDVTDAAASALADFDRLVVVHAGDRKRLDMMLALQVDEGRAETDSSYRRTAFQANTYLWGVSANVTLMAHFVGLSDTPGKLDAAGLRGFVGVQRIRPNLRLPILRPKVWNDRGALRGGLAFEPLYDLDNPPEEVRGLLLSDPAPRLGRTELPEGLVRYDLLPGPVGKTGSVTCLTGGISRRIGSSRATADDASMGCRAVIDAPCELLVFDELVDERFSRRIQPEVAIHSLLHGDLLEESERLPVQETVRYMGKASGALHTPEIPRYSEMVGYTFGRLGWDASRFDVYRFRWEYPIMPSIVTISRPLLPPPGEA